MVEGARLLSVCGVNTPPRVRIPPSPFKPLPEKSREVQKPPVNWGFFVYGVRHLPVPSKGICPKAPELLAVLRRIESRGALETAHRVMQNCGRCCATP